MGSDAVTTTALLLCFLIRRQKLGNEPSRQIVRSKNAGLVPQKVWPSWGGVFVSHSFNLIRLGKQEEERVAGKQHIWVKYCTLLSKMASWLESMYMFLYPIAWPQLCVSPLLTWFSMWAGGYALQPFTKSSTSEVKLVKGHESGPGTQLLAQFLAELWPMPPVTSLGHGWGVNVYTAWAHYAMWWRRGKGDIWT